jgi:hypothetical protein
MNALTHWDAETSWEIRLLRQFRWNQLILRRLPWVVFRRAEWTFLPPGVRLPPALRTDLWESFRRPAVRHFIVRMCAGYQGALPRLPEQYRRITCPTLILWAGEDKHFPSIHARIALSSQASASADPSLISPQSVASLRRYAPPKLVAYRPGTPWPPPNHANPQILQIMVQTTGPNHPPACIAPLRDPQSVGHCHRHDTLPPKVTATGGCAISTMQINNVAIMLSCYQYRHQSRSPTNNHLYM